MLVRIVTADRRQGEEFLERCRQFAHMETACYDDMAAALTAMRIAPADILFIVLDGFKEEPWETLAQMQQVDPQLCFACLTDMPQRAHRAFAMGALDVLPLAPRQEALAFALGRAIQAGQGLIQAVLEQTPLPASPCATSLLSGLSGEQRQGHTAFLDWARPFVALLAQQPAFSHQLPQMPPEELALALSLHDAGRMLFQKLPPAHTRLYAAIREALPKLTYACLAQCRQQDIERRGEAFWTAATEAALYANAWVDGSGEPAGLRGEDIPLCARICAVIRQMQGQVLRGCTQAQALSGLRERANAQLDARLVDIFCQAWA